MTIETIYRQDVVSVHAGDSLVDAANEMQFNEVSALVVYDEDRLVGIITERDLTRAVAECSKPAYVSVKRYMTEDPVIISPEITEGEAIALMTGIGVRHLPVGCGDRIVGMVSARDLLEA